MAKALQTNGRHIAVVAAATAVPAAGTVTFGPYTGLASLRSLLAEARLTYTSGGTSLDVYVQTSLDGGLTWIDVMNLHFLTATAVKVSKVDLATALAAATVPGDGALASDSIKDGLLGERVRVKVITAGTYVGTYQIDLVAKA